MQAVYMFLCMLVYVSSSHELQQTLTTTAGLTRLRAATAHTPQGQRLLTHLHIKNGAVEPLGGAVGQCEVHQLGERAHHLAHAAGAQGMWEGLQARVPRKWTRRGINLGLHWPKHAGRRSCAMTRHQQEHSRPAPSVVLFLIIVVGCRNATPNRVAGASLRTGKASVWVGEGAVFKTPTPGQPNALQRSMEIPGLSRSLSAFKIPMPGQPGQPNTLTRNDVPASRTCKR